MDLYWGFPRRPYRDELSWNRNCLVLPGNRKRVMEERSRRQSQVKEGGERGRRGMRGFLIGTVICVASLPLAGCFHSGNVAGWAPLVRPGSLSSARTRHVRGILEMRSGPAPGEVRNPWGRAGKPETRAARQKEQEETVELRAKCDLPSPPDALVPHGRPVEIHGSSSHA